MEEKEERNENFVHFFLSAITHSLRFAYSRVKSVTVLWKTKNAELSKQEFQFKAKSMNDYSIKGLKLQNIRTIFSQCPLFLQFKYSLLFISFHSEWAKYIRKPYALVSGITKKLFTADGWNKGVKICIIHELKSINNNDRVTGGS